MKPRIYSVTIRKDNNVQSKGLYPGSGQTHAAGNYSYRSIAIVTGSFIDAVTLARAKVGKDEEIESIVLQSDDVIVDPSADLDSD